VQFVRGCKSSQSFYRRASSYSGGDKKNPENFTGGIVRPSQLMVLLGNIKGIKEVSMEFNNVGDETKSSDLGEKWDSDTGPTAGCSPE